MKARHVLTLAVVLWMCALATSVSTQSGKRRIGAEVSVPMHLQDGEEYQTPLASLIEHGKRLVAAVWTEQEGGGRPLTKGTGGPLSDPSSPLVFPRDFNRVSAPDANSCAGCHNAPFGAVGGGGDIVANVFVLGHRFDFATFDDADQMPTRGGVDERGQAVKLQTVANSRATLGMFGSGFIEMLARQMTADLQAIRNATAPGTARQLVTKGVSFGVIARGPDGSWITTGVEGLSSLSLRTTGPSDPPSLVIRPFSQSGAIVSLREFTNNAFNHHHGIQSTERFGANIDPDGDGFVNELTRADVTAATIFQATMGVPLQVMPADTTARGAVQSGSQHFSQIGCASCHIPALPLDREGWVFVEPNPYNPPGNLRTGEAPELRIDLTSSELPEPRLKPANGVVWVPAFTDLKLHDITGGPTDPNREPLDQTKPAGSDAFFAGNSRFLTKKLWGAANEPPYFHHGQFTTMRRAILAHSGEALASRVAFTGLTPQQQDNLVEFLLTLQVVPSQ